MSTSLPPWVSELLDNPILQLLAFVCVFVLRVELDRWLRKQDTKAQKKQRKVANG